MTPQQAIRILMLSPCYWLLSTEARKQLVREFCASYAAVAGNGQPRRNTKGGKHSG